MQLLKQCNETIFLVQAEQPVPACSSFRVSVCVCVVPGFVRPGLGLLAVLWCLAGVCVGAWDLPAHVHLARLRGIHS